MKQLEKPFLWYQRRPAFLLGLAVLLTGLITWWTGWQYGHGLTTLALAILIVGSIDWKLSPHLAGALMSYYETVAHLERGDRKAAERTAARAVRRFGRLADNRPAERWRHASMLDHHWRLLNEADRHEEAVTVARQCVESWQQVVVSDPGRRDELSRSLNHLAVTLSRLERDDEVVTPTEESIAIRRRLIAEHETLLAVDLSNRTNNLRERGELQASLPVAEEVASIRGRLVAEDPDLLEPAAESTHNLMRVLVRLDRAEDAVKPALEWVGYERSLAAEESHRLPDLAEALYVLGSVLKLANRPAEATARWHESLDLSRRLSEENEEQRPAFAAACSMIGEKFSATGETEEAIAVYQDAIAARRALIDQDGQLDRLVEDLAATAECHRRRGELEQARLLAVEAVVLCRESPSSTNDGVLVGPLHVLASVHEDLGELEPALALGEEALVLLDGRAANDHDELHHLMKALDEHAVLLHRAGRSADARQVELRAVNLREEHDRDTEL